MAGEVNGYAVDYFFLFNHSVFFFFAVTEARDHIALCFEPWNFSAAVTKLCVAATGDLKKNE